MKPSGIAARTPTQPSRSDARNYISSRYIYPIVQQPGAQGQGAQIPKW